MVLDFEKGNPCSGHLYIDKKTMLVNFNGWILANFTNEVDADASKPRTNGQSSTKNEPN